LVSVWGGEGWSGGESEGGADTRGLES
jgi:hypothetical protein